MPLCVDIPVKEVQRYMGYHGIAEVTPEMQEKINKAIDQVSTQSHPRIIFKEFAIEVAERTVVIHAESENVVLESESLARNLSGCRRALLLAATIGPSCDMLVRRASVTSAADSAVYQAAGAAAIEAFLDNENDRLKKEYEKDDLYLRPRFSPGYGDLKLEHQKDWFRLLDISRQIGIELTDSLLMVPTKSVTAIIGIGGDVRPSGCTGCSGCNMHGKCEFSSEKG